MEAIILRESVLQSRTASIWRHQVSGECSFLGLSLVLDELAGNSVHVGLALVGEGLASGLGSAIVGFVLDLTNESLVFELLQAVSDDLSAGLSVMRWADSPSHLATVVSSQG